MRRSRTSFDEEARATMHDDTLLEPRDDLLARALRVATVRVARCLACVDQGEVAMLDVLRMQLFHDRLLMPVTLICEQTNHELAPHSLVGTEVGVLRIPQVAQQLPPRAVALIDADWETNNCKVRLATAAWRRGGCSANHRQWRRRRRCRHDRRARNMLLLLLRGDIRGARTAGEPKIARHD